jgi:hypothetical protein
MLGTRGLAIVTACALASFLAGCFHADFDRDGAGCSQEGTCPPGQTCSVDGQCLFPCPIPDCVGETCGCKQHGDVQVVAPGDGEYQCFADGLCHITCMLEYSSCKGDLVCGANGTCLPRCGDSDGCPNGATCQTPASSDWYCLGGDLDGGVVGDAGICTECSDAGCVFLDTDPAHCGSCYNDCQIGDCVGGMCQPRVLAYGPEISDGAVMALAGDIVYWTVRASQGVYACHRTLCESPTLVCVGPACGSPTALAVGTSDLFWIDEHGGDARILACPLSGCTAPPTVVAEGLGRATALAYNDTLLYFSSSEGLQRCPEVDCGDYAQVIHATDFSTDTVSLAVGESDVVWTSFNGGAVRRCPKTGCLSDPLVLVEDPVSFPASIIMNTETISWVMYGLGEVQRCPLIGCNPAGPEAVGSFRSGEPPGHLSRLAFVPDGVVVVDNDYALRTCAYAAGGESCNTLSSAGTSVWATITTSYQTVLFGVADGRILELATP